MGMTPKVNHSRFDFNLMFLTLGIFTTEGTKKNHNNNNNHNHNNIYNNNNAFLASVAATHTLQSLLLHNSHHLADLHRDNLLSTWLTSFSSTTSASPSDGNQSVRDKPIIAADVDAVKSHFCDSFNTSRLLAVSAPYSGDRLHALPLATCGLKLDNGAIGIAVGLRLGVNL